jgi:hypothetical protein
MKSSAYFLCIFCFITLLSACATNPTPQSPGLMETGTAQARALETINISINTSTVTETPKSTSIPTEDPYLINDEFDDPNSGWPTFGDTSSGEVGYRNGYFRLAFYQLGYFNSAYSLGTYDDYFVETRFCTSDTTPEIGAGLTLRASDYKWYLFWIYPVSREYTFLKGVSDPATGFYQATDLLPRASSDLIRPINSSDMLCLSIKAAAHGDTFDFWVAGEDGKYQFLASAHDPELTTGHLGPSADAPKSNFSPSPVEALFDWIKVYVYVD